VASWAGRTPLDNSSGKRTGSAGHKEGNRYIAAITGETAGVVGKTQTREGARYRTISRRRGKNKACVALGNTQLRAACPAEAVFSAQSPVALRAAVGA